MSDKTNEWHTGETLAGSGYTGTPAFIQSRFGQKGNFEVVVPEADGNGFAQFWRDNDSRDLYWNGPSRIDKATLNLGTGATGEIAQGTVGKVDAISMVQADNFGTHGLGDFNVIVRSGDKLKLFWQEDRGDFPWHGPYPLPGSGFI